MPSNQTPNYRLSQWERTDRVLMEDFNADNAKIDATLAGLAGQVTGKAAQSALDALSQTVAGHTAALSRKGNCRIEVLSYTGNGKFGAEYQNSLTFSGKPVFFLVFGMQAILFYSKKSSGIFTLYNGGYKYATSILSTTWSGNTVRWYGESAANQGNESGSYCVVALYAEDAS